MSLITIPAEATPTGLVTCSFRRPKYVDRREASRKYPGAGANPGYTLEQLFFAYCLESINGQELPKNPHDYISRLEHFPLEDSQFCVDVFLELSTLNRDSSSAAVDLGTKLKKTLADSYEIPSSEMPGQGPSVRFRAPRLQDSIAANRSIPREETAYTPEELLLASSITEINGKAVEKPNDPIELLDDLWHEDVQFLLGIYFSMFTLDRPKREGARSLAKSIKEGAAAKSADTSVKIPAHGSKPTSATSK